MTNLSDKKPTDKPVIDKKLKRESLADKQKRKLNEDYKKRYFAFYDDVKISDREDW